MNIFALPKEIVIGPLRITYYAIFILIGAAIAYFIAAYTAKKKGYDFRIFESVFYIAFPTGIIGARIWYVIAEWQKTFAGKPFENVFKIWEGGLAIQGGVLLGGLAGILFVYFRRKNLRVLDGIDFVFPGILVAQAIGRIGNFFNQEVYGQCVDRNTWGFLPSFILDQMSGINGSGCLEGEIATPLFLIEALTNLAGFLIIYFGIGYLLRKYKAPGDMAATYFIWYGLTRIILEKQRNDQFIMGDKIAASYAMGWVFFIGGIVAIVACHLYDKYYYKPRIASAEAGYKNFIDKRNEDL